MANRRCIDCLTVNSLRFTNMSAAARAFYLSLIANADADGIVEAGFILRATRTRKTALQELIDNNFVAMLIPDNNIVWVMDWQTFNTNDKRYGQPSHYRETLLEHFPNIKVTEFAGKTSKNPTGNTAENKTIPDKTKQKETILYDTNGDTENHNNNVFSSDDRIPKLDDVITECSNLGYVSETKTIAEQFLSTNEKYHWKLVLKDNKPWIDVLKQFLGQSNYANKTNPEDVRTAHIRKMEQEAEKERRRQEEAEKYQSQSLYLETAEDFINYIKNEKPFSHEEAVKKVAISYVFNDDKELAELWNPQPVFVDESYGWNQCQFIRYDPNNGIIGFDGYMYKHLDTPLMQKVRKDFTENADPKPELHEFLEEMEMIPKHKEPEPFIPKTAFDDLQ